MREAQLVEILTYFASYRLRPSSEVERDVPRNLGYPVSRFEGSGASV